MTFNRLLATVPLVLLSLLTLLSPEAEAAAQFGLGGDQKAQATLWVRSEGERVRAVVRFEIDPGWHLYHDDLGPPDAIGMPTTVTLEAAGVTWDAPVFPTPHRYVQAGLGEDGGDTYIQGHADQLVVKVDGVLADPAASLLPSGVTARLKGLTCEDDGVCIPYNETVAGAGAGPDNYFADFLAAAPQAQVEEEDDFDLDSFFDGLGGADDDEIVAAQLSVRSAGDDSVRAVLVLDIADGWHLYHTELGQPDAVGKPTKVEIEAPGVEWSAPVFPEPHRFEQPGLGDGGRDTWILGHEGQVVVLIEGHVDVGRSVPAPGDVTVTLDGLTCEEDGVCMPFAATVRGSGAGSDELFAGFAALQTRATAKSPTGTDSSASGDAAESSPASDRPTDADGAPEQAPDDGLVAFLGLAIFWGLFTLLMPCTYPMIPITISFFTKQADARGGKVLPLALAYGAGIVGIFVFIGVVVGGPIITLATDPIFNTIIGLLFFYFALVLFGAINMNPPRFLMDAAGKASTKGGLIGVFLMGATLVITSFTCTAPFVASLLSVGATGGGGVGRVVIGMAVFGLTIALPFVFLSLLPGRLASIPKSGAWMGTLKVALGFVELAAAFKFFSNADLVWGLNVLSRELFLALWMAIFAVAGAFVLGFIKLKGESGEIGPIRMLAGLGFVLLATYSGYGASGRMLDPIMTAIVPPYSHSIANEVSGASSGAGESRQKGHTIVEDDYDGALALARQEGKLLLVNFTGHT
ncbi:protein-disulfide reductase DsbD family protein [Engelhardtia mirabilis]|uniref:Thiol:disulfide interchange protein DsbD n=1 Tax=Engelhardtia mirabilis TaxID=2528011 RepID=A0A518BSZ4_9BACT|nr:Thiol:disulfide interchange protein DsbD precursor [Planctomycetes bacterium Pla133]QDV04419.1 Thiol:disulfide interchange protein DsbD precursor [Planctomycetes bacterium Pla86]